jgi:hypothetical protein
VQGCDELTRLSGLGQITSENIMKSAKSAFFGIDNIKDMSTVSVGEMCFKVYILDIR